MNVSFPVLDKLSQGTKVEGGGLGLRQIQGDVRRRGLRLHGRARQVMLSLRSK